MEKRSRRGASELETDSASGTGSSFGQLLRRYRTVARLTQEELAERSGYSTDYIGKLERDQRQPPLIAVDRLAAVLDLGDREHEQLLAARERHGAAQPRVHATPDLALLPLPMPATVLIGRVAERAAVHAALGTSRLITLTGVGGTGKTRLALEVARAVAADGVFGDGVVFVDCAPLPDPALLAPTLARALSLTEQPTLPPEAHLIQVLRPRHLLLVADNLEHLLEGVPLLGRLLAAAPQLHVLATSRAPLHLYGEHEIRVPTLSLPPLTALDRGGSAPEELDLVASEAVQLFVVRARAVTADFAPTGSTLSAIAALCVALDGLPLAIELAAGRVKLFPPKALLSRLEERLAVLTGGPRDLPGRQQTLRATLDWSYELLPPMEQRLFARLGVFAGSFDAAAAAAICAPDDTHDTGQEASEESAPPLLAIGAAEDRMLARLEALAEQSLVEVVPGSTPRFRLFETVRAYALAQLAEAGEEGVIRDGHLHYYRGLSERMGAALTGPEQGSYLARLEEEHDNLRAALGWAQERAAVDEGLRLAGALGHFWRLHGYLREGLSWLETLLAVPGSASPAVRAQGLTSAGSLPWRLGGYARATSLLTEALTVSRQVGDTAGIARALGVLGNVASRQGDYGRAAACHTEALSLRRQTGDLQGVSMALGDVGRVAFRQGDTVRALTLLEETLALKRRLGDIRGIAGTLTSLGRVAARQGDLARATALFEESLALKQTLGDRHGRVTTLVQLGSVALSQGNSARAAALLGESLRLGQEIGASDRVAEALETLAAAAAADGRPQEAARFGGAADALRSSLGLPLSLDQQASHDQTVRMVRAALGEDAFAALWAVGEAQPLGETIVEALELADQADST